MEKMSHERRAYESVDYRSLFWAVYQNFTEKDFR